MALRIEDYGLIGDLHTAALVGRDGSIDWLCLPRFDSGSCFAALLGNSSHGRWKLAPVDPIRVQSWHYRENTLVLEREVETETGACRIVDFMPRRGGDAAHVVRIVEGLRGQVRLRSELVPRFDYGEAIPWIEQTEDGISAASGPDALLLRTPVAMEEDEQAEAVVGEFTVTAGETVPLILSWRPSHLPPPALIDPVAALEETEGLWREWSSRLTYAGEWRDIVLRSVITLKALTYGPTGGIVAAPTTSLPEAIGGERNWDYRYCWLRDAALSIQALLRTGYTSEARAFREWLLRAVTGHPRQAHIMYGLSGERRLTEYTLPGLPGYEGSAPVHIGNAASEQFQLDIFGELADAFFLGMDLFNIPPEPGRWQNTVRALEVVEEVWNQPDEGIWEVRGPRRHFTHSKVMAWVAFDRAVRIVERFGAAGPVDRWRAIRDEIHDQVCREGYDTERRTFTQSYGSQELDASVLLIPAVGFLPPTDERVVGTVEAVQRWLTRDGFVDRYSTGGESGNVDGLAGVEGSFLPCSFWLADALAGIGRTEEARALFARLVALSNDLGLIAEEYDPIGKRLLGNFPQAFTHLALINTAVLLTAGPAGPSGALSVTGSTTSR
jgi:GH15 family glucan-1,4-alpha-glucosidase